MLSIVKIKNNELHIFMDNSLSNVSVSKESYPNK